MPPSSLSSSPPLSPSKEEPEEPTKTKKSLKKMLKMLKKPPKKLKLPVTVMKNFVMNSLPPLNPSPNVLEMPLKKEMMKKEMMKKKKKLKKEEEEDTEYDILYFKKKTIK